MYAFNNTALYRIACNMYMGTIRIHNYFGGDHNIIKEHVTKPHYLWDIGLDIDWSTLSSKVETQQGK
jgi:hypothetical protein